jgi:hypothetical protein
MEIDGIIDFEPVVVAEPKLPGDDADSGHLRKLHPIPEFDDHVFMARIPHKYFLSEDEPFPEKRVEEDLMREEWRLDLSVTGFFKRYTGDFDAVGTAKKILARQQEHETCLQEGIEQSRPEWFLEQYERYKHCRTVEELHHEWNVNRDKGTATHRLIEMYYNNMLSDEVLRLHPACCAADFQQFLAFHEREIEARGFEPFRTELTMFKLKIGGQIDMLYRLKADRDHPERKYDLWMVDWKRKFDLGLFGDAYKEPFVDMQPGDQSKFTIQLNTYKSMIESATPYRIRKMSILLVHPKLGEQYMLVPVPDIGTKIEVMFERRRRVLVGEMCTKIIDALRTHALSEDALVRNAGVNMAQNLLDKIKKIDPEPLIDTTSDLNI